MNTGQSFATMAETQPLMEFKPLYVEYSKFSGSTVEFDERGAKTSLNTLTAAVMVAGTLAGSGTLALPGAVINTGETQHTLDGES